MFKKIKNIYDYEISKLTNRRIIILLFTLVSVVMSLFVLFFINRILIKGRIEGSFQYEDLLFLYELIWNVVFFLSVIFIVVFSSTSINGDKNKKILDNMLATKFDKKYIIYGKFINIFIIDFSMMLLCMPIIMITTFFGGISYTKMFFIFIFILFFNIFFINFTLMLSSYIYQENISIFISLFFGIIFGILFVFYKNLLINNIFYYLISLLTFFVFSVIFVIFTILSSIFS